MTYWPTYIVYTRASCQSTLLSCDAYKWSQKKPPEKLRAMNRIQPPSLPPLSLSLSVWLVPRRRWENVCSHHQRPSSRTTSPAVTVHWFTQLQLAATYTQFCPPFSIWPSHWQSLYPTHVIFRCILGFYFVF